MVHIFVCPISVLNPSGGSKVDTARCRYLASFCGDFMGTIGKPWENLRKTMATCLSSESYWKISAVVYVNISLWFMKYVVHELFSEGSLQVELTETVQETSMYTSMAVFPEVVLESKSSNPLCYRC